MLDAAGVASRPFDIGLSPAHHQETVLSARFIRRRYTLLDLLAETDMLDMAVEEIFLVKGSQAIIQTPPGQTVGRKGNDNDKESLD